jgi:uncharacterized protein
MKLLPNFERAVIPIQKLASYALNPEHPEGKHKARVFKSALEIERRHAGALAELIRASLPKAPAEREQTTEYGDLWTNWHAVIGLNGQSAIITAAWMYKKQAADIPELVSCYIESRNQEKLRKLFD